MACGLLASLISYDRAVVAAPVSSLNTVVLLYASANCIRVSLSAVMSTQATGSNCAISVVVVKGAW